MSTHLGSTTVAQIAITVHDAARPCYERFPPGSHEGTATVEIHVPVKAKV